MAKKEKEKLPSIKRSVATLLPPKIALAVDDIELEYRKFNEIVDLLFCGPDISDVEKDARRLRALELYQDLSPQDGLEGMLGAQMVGTTLLPWSA